MKGLKEAIIALTVIGILDALWIGANFARYKSMYSSVQSKNMKVKFQGAIMAYAFVLLTFVAIALPFARQNMNGNIVRGMLLAGLVGFCTYGVYNATNYALFERYSASVALMDTVWGGVLFALTSYTVIKYSQYLGTT